MESNIFLNIAPTFIYPPRNSWSLHDSVKKEDDDSDEGGNNFRPENQEKEDCDVSLAEDFSWISSDKELICK